MSVASFNTSLAEFFASKEPEVLAIKGRWGTGKTYSWDAAISHHQKNTSLNQKYAYVSLFGPESLWEVKLTLLARLHATQNGGNWIPRVFGSKKVLNSTVHLISLLSGGETLAKAASEWSPTLLKGAIVCIDDFERVDEKSIPHERILGFISELKLEHECKVVLIYNSDAVKDESKFHEYREKVIDREIEYSPSYEDVVSIAGQPSGDSFNVSVNCARILELDNVRILRRALKTVEQFRVRCTQPLSRQIEKKLLSSAILFAWMEFGDGKQQVPSAVRENPEEGLANSWVELHIDGKPLEPWQEKLEQYSFTSFDELDALVWSCIKTGHIESDRILREVDKLNQIEEKDRAISRHKDAWRLFFDSLENNEELFVKELTDSFKTAAPHLSPTSLSSTVSILNDLGQPDLAKQMIDMYVECRDSRSGDFDLSNYPFRSDINNQEILDAFSNALSKGSAAREGDTEMLANLLKHGAPLNKLRQALLSNCSVDQIVGMLKAHQGQELDMIIGQMMRYQNHRHAPQIGALIEDALKQISRESKYQELRTKRRLQG